MSSPLPTQFNIIAVSTDEDGFVVDKEISLLGQGPSPSTQTSWGAPIIKGRLQALLSLPVDAPPFVTIFNHSDLAINYYPSAGSIFDSLKSAFDAFIMGADVSVLPKEGYLIYLGGLIDTLRRAVGRVATIRSRHPRVSMLPRIHPQLNLGKILRLKLGSIFGFNNLGKVILGDDNIFVELLCGIDESTATLLNSILLDLQADLTFLSQSFGYPSKTVKIIILHRKR